MNNKKFTCLEQPILVESVRMATTEEVIQDLHQAEQDGAQACLIHFEMLEEKECTMDNVERIIRSTNLPIMALNYRDKTGKENASVDLVRTEFLLETIKRGATMVDLWGNAFDDDCRASLQGCDKAFAVENPNEISMDKACIERQKQFIDKAHALGGEVLISVHAGVELSKEACISLALEIEERGADIVKIIGACNSERQMLIVLDTIRELKERLKVPYLYQCGGKYGKIVRPIAPLFGSSMALCHVQYGGITNPEKPLLKDVKNVWRILKGEEK